MTKKFSVLEVAQGKAPRLEKQVERAGDRFMAQMGFTSIHFSQARATMQTPGIPDRKYYNIERGVSCWWEAKAEDGEQSEPQHRFQRMTEACGEVYLLGTEGVLARWCQDGCPEADSFLGMARDDSFLPQRYAPERFRWSG